MSHILPKWRKSHLCIPNSCERYTAAPTPFCSSETHSPTHSACRVRTVNILPGAFQSCRNSVSEWSRILGQVHLATEQLRHSPDNLAGWRVPWGSKVHCQRVNAIPYTADIMACRPFDAVLSTIELDSSRHITQQSTRAIQFGRQTRRDQHQHQHQHIARCDIFRHYPQTFPADAGIDIRANPTRPNQSAYWRESTSAIPAFATLEDVLPFHRIDTRLAVESFYQANVLTRYALSDSDQGRLQPGNHQWQKGCCAAYQLGAVSGGKHPG